MNIANQLTLFRIILIPVFILLMLDSSVNSIALWDVAVPMSQAWAALVFTVASLTDFLDGYLARKYGLVTTFGAFFDPMADKLLVIAAFLLLVQLQVIPAWIVIIIISRELMVTGLRVLIAQANGKVLSAALPGKIKTATQMLAIILFILNEPGKTLLGFSLAQICLWVCMFFTVYSGVEYFYKARFVFKQQ